MMLPRSRTECIALDAVDPLASRRELFDLPAGVIYLDGNSLGAVTHKANERLQQTIAREWATDLIASWNRHGWMDWPTHLGARLAPLLGAAADEVIVGDSTSVNLFKLAAAAARQRGTRHKIVTERGNFPTDPYILEGLASLIPELELVVVERNALDAAIDETTFLVVLTHIHYRSAEMYDLAAVTRRAHLSGARILWDLSHSVGAVPLALAAAQADFAVGCTYKYLNGGPGAPAFMYVRRDLQADLAPVLSGWLGHSQPFDFADDYKPAAGMARHRCGTPPVLAFAALDGALVAFEGLDLQVLRRKSLALAELFIERVAALARGSGLTLASPSDPALRGSHLSFAHPAADRLIRRLSERGVVGDFRPPDLLRFGLTPLYLRYVDIWDAVEMLASTLADADLRN